MILVNQYSLGRAPLNGLYRLQMGLSSSPNQRLSTLRFSDSLMKERSFHRSWFLFLSFRKPFFSHSYFLMSSRVEIRSTPPQQIRLRTFPSVGELFGAEKFNSTYPIDIANLNVCNATFLHLCLVWKELEEALL